MGSRSRLAAAAFLAARYLMSRGFATAVSIAAIALSLFLVVGVAEINFAVKKAAVEGAIRYPLIVGPEGSSAVQLIFSTIFHADKPVGTIPAAVLDELRADHRVIAAHPIAVADAVGAYPIVGTDTAYLASLGASAAAGAIDLSRPENAVLGAEAARRTDLRLGNVFSGSHGPMGGEDADVHTELQYKVAGILAATGGPEDAAVYTSFQTVWLMHGEAHGDHDKYDLERGRLTAILVRTGNPAFAAELEREITLKPGTLAVDTGRTVRRVVDYLNKGERVVEIMGGLSLVIAVALIFVTLVMSIHERRKELALLRCLGVPRFTISLVIMIEALVIAAAGAGVGVIGGHLAIFWAEVPINAALGVAVEPWGWTRLETAAVLVALIASQLLAAASLIWTYRMRLVEEVARD